MQRPLVKQTTFVSFQHRLSPVTPTVYLPILSLKRWSGQDLNRMLIHVIILLLIIGMIPLGKIQLSQRYLKASTYNTPDTPSLSSITIRVNPYTGHPLTLPGNLINRNSDLILPAPVPRTIIPDRTEKIDTITTYAVQPGDTVFGIAAKFGLAPETLFWANRDLEAQPDLLTVGQEITIIPVDGVYHQVANSDTVEGIAATFKASPEAILTYPLNNLDPANPVIIPGQWLVVPGGVKPYVARQVSVTRVNAPETALDGTGSFQWPASGNISQEYWSGHRALDISAWIGAAIHAADSGYVVAAGWDNSGYGNMIVVDHGNGFQTLYAHLETMYVSVGDEISQGQQIGEMGCTGWCTGPHLHFEVILNGAQRNPWGFLP